MFKFKPDDAYIRIYEKLRLNLKFPFYSDGATP